MSNRLSRRQRRGKYCAKGNTPYKYYLTMKEIIRKRGEIVDGLEQGTQEGNGAGSGSGDCYDSQERSEK